MISQPTLPRRAHAHTIQQLEVIDHLLRPCLKRSIRVVGQAELAAAGRTDDVR